MGLAAFPRIGSRPSAGEIPGVRSWNATTIHVCDDAVDFIPFVG